jgi:hypothetical protein
MTVCLISFYASLESPQRMRTGNLRSQPRVLATAATHGGYMKSYTPILMLLFVSLFVPLAEATSGSADYPITVHVSSSQLYPGYLQLNVVIEGKKYCLSGGYASVLSPGDYKAKLVKDEHKTSYETDQTYEFLFPDNKTRRHNLIGQSE